MSLYDKDDRSVNGLNHVINHTIQNILGSILRRRFVKNTL